MGSAVAGFLDSLNTHLQTAFPLRDRPVGAPQPPPGGNASALLPDGFYRIIPLFEGGASLPGKPAVARNGASPVVSYSSRCFSQNQAKVASAADGKIALEIAAQGPAKGAGLLTPCTELYMIVHPGDVQFASIKTDGSKQSETVNVSMNYNLTELPAGTDEWLGHSGVRVLRFMYEPLDLIGYVADTLSLFVPSLAEPTLDAGSAQRNLQFLSDYTGGVQMPERSTIVTPIPESDIQTGTLMAINRLDGLGTLEDWATGARTTHIAMLMWLGSGADRALHVVESTDTESYWPNPNVQSTLLKEWIPMAVAANYSVAILPLKPELQAKFDADAAELFVAGSLGERYGYRSFVATFYDVAVGSLPWPAAWQSVESLFQLIGLVDPAIPELIMNEGLNKRLNTTGLGMIAAANLANQRNMSWGELLAMPEQDNWVYSDGPARVCDSYACAIYKAGGLFGDLADQIQCVEFQNRDVYSLDFYDIATSAETDTRPDACKEADPSLPYCMLLGTRQILLNGVNTITPYAHMNEKCASVPPKYERADGC